MKIQERKAQLLVSTLLVGALSVGAHISVQAQDGNEQELLELSRSGETAAALDLIGRRTDVNVSEADGTTALHWAVYYQDYDLVRRLIRADANVHARNEYGSTPLQQAAISANAEILELLLDAGADANELGADGQTPLMIVSRTDAIESARILLDAGADPNAVEQWRGQTALMWASAQKQPEMVKLLLDAGADPDAQSLPNNWERQVTAEPRMKILPVGGFTPLLYATREGCPECVRHLVNAGADLNKADPDGTAPMLMATLNAKWDSARVLLEAGANVDKWDIYGRSPLYSAVDYNTLPHGGRADRLSADQTTSLEFIELLLDAGANPNLQLKLFPPYRSLGADRGADGLLRTGVTPLFRAARGADVEAMKLLLAHGARVDLTNENGVTVLMVSTGYRQSGIDTRGRFRTEEEAYEATKVLLEAGDIDIDTRDEATGQTALFGAATIGWTSLVELLVEHGADPTVEDNFGNTVVDAAMGRAGMFGRGAGGDQHLDTAAVIEQLIAQRQ